MHLPCWYFLRVASDDQILSVVKDCRMTTFYFTQITNVSPFVIFVFGNYWCSPILRNIFTNPSTQNICSWISRCRCIIGYPEYFENTSKIEKMSSHWMIGIIMSRFPLATFKIHYFCFWMIRSTASCCEWLAKICC